MRALVVGIVVATIGLVPVVSASAAGSDPGAAIFTVGGGGSLPPVDGRPATQARLTPTDLTVRRDGTIVFVDESTAGASLWAIGVDGRLRLVSVPGARISDVAAETPTDALLAIIDGQLMRLAAGASRWQVLFTAPHARPPARRPATPVQVAAIDDGRILIGGTYLSWVLSPEGHVLETIREGAGEAIAPIDDGGVALLSNHAGLVMWRPGAGLRRTGDRLVGVVDVGLTPSSDGSMLLADGLLYRISADLRLHHCSVTSRDWALATAQPHADRCST